MKIPKYRCWKCGKYMQFTYSTVSKRDGKITDNANPVDSNLAVRYFCRKCMQEHFLLYALIYSCTPKGIYRPDGQDIEDSAIHFAATLKENET